MPIPYEKNVHWQKHFAWIPVKTINGKWRWLNTVMQARYYPAVPSKFPYAITEYITVDDYVEAKLRGDY